MLVPFVARARVRRQSSPCCSLRTRRAATRRCRRPRCGRSPKSVARYPPGTGTSGGNGSKASSILPDDTAPAAPAERRHVRAYSLPELAALHPEQVEWVLGDYIAAGDVASLESAPKGGKSTLLRKLHVHVATGTPFFGRAVKQGPSLYCTEERAGTSREGFARAGGLHLPDLHVMFLHDFHGMDWAERVEEIAEHCKRLGVVLVSFDTLSKWAGLVGEEEQSAGAAMEVMGPLQRLAATGCAVAWCATNARAAAPRARPAAGAAPSPATLT